MSKFDKVYKDFFEEAIFVNQNPSKGEPTVIDDANRLNSEEQLILKKWKMGDPTTREKWKVASWKSNVIHAVDVIKQPNPYQQPEFNFDDDPTYSVYEKDTDSTKTPADLGPVRRKYTLKPHQEPISNPAASEELPLEPVPGAAPAPSPTGDVAPEEPAAAPKAPRRPSLVSKVGQGLDKAVGYLPKRVQNAPAGLAGALAQMGGYYDPVKNLSIAVQNTNSLRTFILNKNIGAPEGADPDYKYYNITNWDNFKVFKDELNKLNPEAASRLSRQVATLDASKQNYITISGVTGQSVYISKIGDQVYVYSS